MLFSFLLFILGLAILVKGADWLVEGASSFAKKFGISSMVIGLTVVAFGTSTPELVVSVFSALKGSTEIALGNVVGSNIFNILMVLGISAAIFPLVVRSNTVWKEIPMSLLAAVILTILGLQNLLDSKDFEHIVSNTNTEKIIGSITFSNGLVLLSFFVIFLYYTFGISKGNEDEGSETKERTITISLAFFILGLLGLVFGSRLLVDNAIILARGFGLSETFIGLTLVAAGTSLPELFTSIVAAVKKNSDIAIGNVVGSNIFNIFLILGITSLVTPIPLSGQNLVDILVLFATTILLFVSLFVYKKHQLGRIEGLTMLSFYLIYLGFLIFRG